MQTCNCSQDSMKNAGPSAGFAKRMAQAVSGWAAFGRFVPLKARSANVFNLVKSVVGERGMAMVDVRHMSVVGMSAKNEHLVYSDTSIALIKDMAKWPRFPIFRNYASVAVRARHVIGNSGLRSGVFKGAGTKQVPKAILGDCCLSVKVETGSPLKVNYYGESGKAYAAAVVEALRANHAAVRVLAE